MNVFVLNTGRCGSTTFIEACHHITNFTSAHESRTGMLGDARFDYPENHIEADNRLSWLLGRLEKRYGDQAFYVHLKRNEDETARSFVRRYSKGIMKVYRRGGILMGLPKHMTPEAVALDYCRTVNSNIELFLKGKTRKMEINLESIQRDFGAFWNRIGAQGNLRDALAEFNTRHNASEQPRGILRALQRPLVKLARHIKGLVGGTRTAIPSGSAPANRVNGPTKTPEERIPSACRD